MRNVPTFRMKRRDALSETRERFCQDVCEAFILLRQFISA